MRIYCIIGLLLILIASSGCLGSDKQCVNTSIVVTAGGAFDVDHGYIKDAKGTAYLVDLYILSRTPLQTHHKYIIQSCRVNDHPEIKTVYMEITK